MNFTTDPIVTHSARGWSLVADGDGDVLNMRVFPCRVGRQPGLPVRLMHKTVSLLHAELRIVGDELILVDLDSRNGTFINGQRLRGSQKVEIGDLLQFGAAVFRLNNARRSVNVPTARASDMGDLALAIAQFDKLIDENVMVPHFQPIVAAANSEVVGFEALARSRLFGLDNPKMMFKAAEFFQKEAQLSRMLRVDALRRGILEEGQQLFLNTHPAELSDLKHLIISLQELRKEFPDRAIVLEVHEACAVEAATIKMIRLVLDDLGMKLAYDDFGSGQARLNVLVEGRPDYLKFDRKMVASIDTGSAERLQLLESLVQMTRQLGIAPLAEGIETAPEAQICRQVGFELMQGYFFGRPIAKPGLSPAPARPQDETPAAPVRTDAATEKFAR